MGGRSIENIRESKKIRVKRLRPVYQGTLNPLLTSQSLSLE